MATWWQRRQEEQADLVAADLLSASGYDPDGITALLAMMGKESEPRLELAKAITKRRDEKLAELAKTAPRQAMQHSPELVIAHTREFAAGTGSDVCAALGSDHPRPQDRQRAVAPYVDGRYDEQRFGPKKLHRRAEAAGRSDIVGAARTAARRCTMPPMLHASSWRRATSPRRPRRSTRRCARRRPTAPTSARSATSSPKRSHARRRFSPSQRGRFRRAQAASPLRVHGGRVCAARSLERCGGSDPRRREAVR